MSESLDVGKWGLKHACYVQVWKLYNTKTMDFHLFFCAKKAQELQVCTNLEIHLLPFPYISVVTRLWGAHYKLCQALTHCGGLTMGASVLLRSKEACWDRPADFST